MSLEPPTLERKSSAFRDEVEALRGIYEEQLLEVGQTSDSELCTLKVDLRFECLELPLQVLDAGIIVLHVSFVPPLHVRINIPRGYPEGSESPTVSLGCAWLVRSQLRDLEERCCNSEREPGEVVLFEWLSRLKDTALDILMGDGQPKLHLPFEQNAIPSKPQLLGRVSSDESGGTHAMSAAALDDLPSAHAALAWLKRWDRRHAEELFRQQPQTCCICMVEVPGNLARRLINCGHGICAEDFCRLCEVHAHDGEVSMMRCPEPKCRVPLHPSEVQKALGPQLFGKYERLVLQRSLAGMGDIAWCPRSWCGQPSVVDEGELMSICPACSFCYCKQCGGVWSVGHDCQNDMTMIPGPVDHVAPVNNPQPPPGPREQDDAQQRRAELARQGAENCILLTQFEIKRCPKCKQAIEKVSGCNHMVCTTCGVHFCWKCLDIISGYDHFNRREAQCGLFALAPVAAAAPQQEDLDDELQNVMVRELEVDDLTVQCSERHCGDRNVKTADPNA
eukprot:gnl/MRDRNA2_/MRDRNA2_29427_c0_seq1.p1 gnl/MRDRNA2_/MRDRNA2_29427_c0~~gnl/MRDRNA2_/MRDRNA2_29427_c0_seq1.p1  ORF type:complete len:506 (-),score=84.76 gnl/MRDRNA2_/MRDRNA2_29427_c0_seq1:317-1834(-)